MSGFVVSFINPKQKHIEKMIDKIKHCGPYIQGSYISKNIIMNQNYLRSHSKSIDPKNIPINSKMNSNLYICYDGLIGNKDDLLKIINSKNHDILDENIILKLYIKFGISMFTHLYDSIFTFIISNNGKILAARDTLGIKILFYGKIEKTFYFSSELKYLTNITNDVYEFPPGHYMDETGALISFSKIKKTSTNNLYKKKFRQIALDLL